MILGLFDDTGSGLSFVTDTWSVRSADGPGWVSLKIGAAEFLHSTTNCGAFAFKLGDRWKTYFPNHGNLSHDQAVGRIGGVADGVNMVKFTPDRRKPEAELYLGANEKETQSVLMFLGDDVRAVQVGDGAELTRERGRTAKGREVAVVHRLGPVLTLRCGKDAGDLEAGMLMSPSGQERLAVAFVCKGFAPNSYQFVFPGSTNRPPRAEDFISGVRFDVKSSDDPPKGNQFGGTAHGACNPIYGPDTKLDFGVLFKWAGAEPFNGSAELEVIHSLGQPHFYQKVALSGITNKETRAAFQPKFHLPGVSEVWCRLVDAERRLIWVERYRMAWDWERYRPRIVVEPDFREFWDKTLAELRTVPLQPATDRVKAYEDHPSFEIYDVTFNGWKKQRLHAMLFVPKSGARPLPAIVTAHPGTTGFGVTKRPDGTYGSDIKHDARFVTIVPLIRGHAPDAPDIPFNHPWWGPLDSRDDYVARSWYCAMVRAVDYLATRPDLVDMQRLVAKGGSQGGALALVTAGLDSRVAVCLADCPANCQPPEIIERYPSFGPTKGQIPAGQTLADVERTLSYYNPVNFCPHIECPAYVGSNIGDLTVHSMGPLAAYHNLTGLAADQKSFYPGFTHFHGSGPGLGLKTREWLEKLGGQVTGQK